MSLYTYMERESLSIWQGLTVQPQRIAHVKPQDQSFLSPVNDENVMSVELLRSRKVASRTGESHFKVTTDDCGSCQ